MPTGAILSDDLLVIPITDLSDRALAPYGLATDRSIAREQGLFVAEGRLVVERLITSRRFRVRSLLVTPTAFRALESPLGQLDASTPVFLASQQQIEGIAGYHIHRGCLALAERPQPIEPSAIAQGANLVVVLDAITDADNVGAIFRNAAAFGVDAVLLGPGTCDPFYRKAIRTSMAATLHVPFARAGAWPDDLVDLRRAGFTIVALSPRADRDIQTLALQVHGGMRVAMILGSEGPGISQHVECLADMSVRIPIADRVDSLNVAVASGIALAYVTSGRLSR